MKEICIISEDSLRFIEIFSGEINSWIMKYLYCIILIVFALTVNSCGEKGEKDRSYIIGFSQAMTTDNWRKEMNRAMKVEASMHPGLKLQIKDAHNDVARQIKQIEDFISQGVNVLIVSPISLPLFAIRDGFVVTPSINPLGINSSI